MTDYVCKCGKQIRKSSTADVTGVRLDNYVPGHECFGCPYALEQVEYTSYPDRETYYECEATKSIQPMTQAEGFVENKNTASIYSLDFDFLTAVAEECRKSEYLGINRSSDGDLFGYKSKYMSNGLFCFTIYPTSNKAGIAAKMAIFDKFFNDQGERKDTGGADETEIIQAQIARGKAAARGEEMSSTDFKAIPAGADPWKEPTPKCKYLADGMCTVCGEKRPFDNPNNCCYNELFFACAYYVEQERTYIKAEEPSAVSTDKTEPDHRSTLVASPLDAVSAALAPAFDYAALDEKTASVLLAAENLIVEARRYYITECANAVGIAHDALCGEACRTVRQARNNQYSENTFLSWCDSVGLKKDTAYRFLQVNALMKGSTIEEQAILEQAPATLLYAAAKPSAPADLVQGVKDGDITTNADYQKLLREKQDLEQEKAQLENVVQCLDENLTESLKRGHETTHKVHEAELKAIKAEEQAQQAKRDFKTVSDVVTQKTAENARLRREAFEATEREQELERKVRELEARPVDVAVQQPSAADIERYRKEGEAAAAAEWKERCDYIEAQNQYLNDAMREREEVALTMQDAEYDTQDEVAAFIYGVGKRAAETVESALALFFETAYEQPDIVYRPALQFLLETHEKFTTAINTGRWFYDVEEVEDELE